MFQYLVDHSIMQLLEMLQFLMMFATFIKVVKMSINNSSTLTTS